MRQTERQDLREVREDVERTRRDVTELARSLDLSAVAETERQRVQTVITMATSGMLLARLDLDDVLNGNRKQQD